MQHIDKPPEANRVNRSIRVTVKVIDDFHDARSVEALEGIAFACLPPSFAELSATPIALRTSFGKLRRSSCEAATQRMDLRGAKPGRRISYIWDTGSMIAK
jgi:hypothetical protein